MKNVGQSSPMWTIQQRKFPLEENDYQQKFKEQN